MEKSVLRQLQAKECHMRELLKIPTDVSLFRLQCRICTTATAQCRNYILFLLLGVAWTAMNQHAVFLADVGGAKPPQVNSIAATAGQQRQLQHIWPRVKEEHRLCRIA